MSNPAEFRAWVDESTSDHVKDPGAYVLVAAISNTTLEQDTRERIANLRLPGQKKLHWRDENDHRRVVITQAVVDCDLEHVVVVRSGAVTDHPERRRRKCLERLLHELALRKIEDVVFESRGPADDRRDLEMLNALRGQHYIPTTVRISHRIGRSEPMLWIPDAVCGAVTSDRTGNPDHRSVLEAQMTVIEI